MTSPNLVGREAEIAMIARLLASVPDQGTSLLISGEAGLGKSALLDEAARQAAQMGWTVLRTAGIPGESGLPMAALHQLIRPFVANIGQLPPPQREAIEAAFGLVDTPVPRMFLVALGILDLLAESAAACPLLVIVDDIQWVDRYSADVLSFVARRLDADPILLLMASRPHRAVAPLDGSPEFALGPLGAAAAAELIDSGLVPLKVRTREVVLQAAAGNPLALLELPKSVDDAAAGLDLLPLTDRLERTFASRASTLPGVTQDVLLLAALNDSMSLGEVLDAATILQGQEVTVDDLEVAMSNGLVAVEQMTVRFRHPLVRSAIHQAASLGRRQGGHEALGRVLARDPDRAVWHRAASVVSPDEEIASELERAAARARQRGTVAVAAKALERAALLSPAPDQRGRRLVRAAELTYDTGQVALSERLLDQAAPAELPPLDRLRYEAVRELLDAGMSGGARRIEELIAFARQARSHGDVDLALQFLLRAATRCWHLGLGPTTEGQVVDEADQLDVSETDPRRIVILAYASPFGRGSEAVERLSDRRSRSDGDPRDLLFLGHAAACTGAFAEAEVLCTAAADGLRAQGRLAPLCQALSLIAWSALRRSRLHVAVPAAAECVRLADETRQPVVQVAGLAAQAQIAAVRGDEEMTLILAAQAEQIGIANRVSIGLALIQYARSTAAAGAGRPSDAFDHLWRIYQVSDPAYQRMQACWAIGSLAEVAAQCGRHEEARSELAKLDAAVRPDAFVGVQVAMSYARAVLAPSERTDESFARALQADLTDWPFEQGRLLLAQGRSLRRQRRVTESRAPLRAACEAFDRADARQWAEAARSELRAAGESTTDPEPKAWDMLSPQELQIAQLVAEGLSNKEIAQRMFLSHRTVGSHLYRMFPKLGVTSRGQLTKAVLGATLED